MRNTGLTFQLTNDFEPESAYTYKNTPLQIGDLVVSNICWCDLCRISLKNTVYVCSLRENKVTVYLKRKIKKKYNFEL